MRVDQDREHRRWTEAEDERLTRMLEAGKTITEAAMQLRRSHSSVQQHLSVNPHLRPAAVQPRVAWKSTDDEQLLRLKRKGLCNAEISRLLAPVLGRSPKAICARLDRLRDGMASTRGLMGRPAKGPLTYSDLVQRFRQQDQVQDPECPEQEQEQEQDDQNDPEEILALARLIEPPPRRPTNQQEEYAAMREARQKRIADKAAKMDLAAKWWRAHDRAAAARRSGGEA